MFAKDERAPKRQVSIARALAAGSQPGTGRSLFQRPNVLQKLTGTYFTSLQLVPCPSDLTLHSSHVLSRVRIPDSFHIERQANKKGSQALDDDKRVTSHGSTTNCQTIHYRHQTIFQQSRWGYYVHRSFKTRVARAHSPKPRPSRTQGHL